MPAGVRVAAGISVLSLSGHRSPAIQATTQWAHRHIAELDVTPLSKWTCEAGRNASTSLCQVVRLATASCRRPEIRPGVSVLGGASSVEAAAAPLMCVDAMP